jgi:lipopolysaccharide biosynthesis protein
VTEFPESVQWVITVPKGSESSMGRVFAKLPNCKVIAVANRGRNFGALIEILEHVQDDQFLLHVHSKKSPHMDELRRDQWRSALFEGLLSRSHVRDAMAIMQTHSDVGIYYPTAEKVISPLSYSWNANSDFARPLLAKLGVPFLQIRFPYPAGGMFIATPWLVEKLRELSLDERDFPNEPLPIDGSVAHALERILGFLPFHSGKRHLTLSMEGEFSFDTSFIEHPSGY